MNPFKNFVVNLQATGSAAVVSILVICLTVLGVFGSADVAKSALGRGLVITCYST